MRTSNRVTKATILSVVMLGTTVLATTESRGDGAKPLSPEQASAKAAFQEAVKSSVDSFKTKCGNDLVVTADFENYDRNTFTNSGGKDGSHGGGDKGGGADKGGGGPNKGKGGDEGKGGGGATPASGTSTPEDWKRDQKIPWGALRQHQNACGEAIDALAEVCSKKTGSGPPPPAVKGIACLLGEQRAAQSGDRTNDQVQRNMSFANGVLTFHISASGAPNIRDNVFEASRPVAEKTDVLNGAQCAKADQCRSGICSKGVCAPCGAQAKCSGARESCNVKTAVCVHTETAAEAKERRAQEQRRAAEQARTCHGAGVSCSMASDCCGEMRCDKEYDRVTRTWSGTCK